MTATSSAELVSEARWVVLIHQIPPSPAYLRVKIGRHLQRLGAVALKNSVYALPASDEAQEDFRWVAGEVTKGGGEVTVMEARLVEGLSDGELSGLFQKAREGDYRELAQEARAVGSSWPKRGPVPEGRRVELLGQLARLRHRLGEVVAIDFFGAPGREVVEGVLAGLEVRMKPATEVQEPRKATRAVEEHQGRTWVTRAGIKVDRMASAWLIRRFIDRQARFKFVPAKGYVREPGELGFDMFEAEFTHEGEACTFEVLLARFGLREVGLRRLGEIVHDIDLKDSKFGRDEAAGIARLIQGVAAAHGSDEERLERGTALFDDLYAAFAETP